MATKILKNLINSYLKINTIILVVLSAILLYFSIPVGLVAFLIIGCLFMYYSKLSVSKTELLGEYASDLVENMEQTTKVFISNNPLGLCMVDVQNGEIQWINKRFADIYSEVEVFHTTLQQLTGIKPAELLPGKEPDHFTTISHGGKIYRVAGPTAGDKEVPPQEQSIILSWTDVTNQENMKNMYRDERLCSAFVNVDNYDDLIACSPDERKAVLAAQIEKTIRQWAARLNASVVRYRQGQYHISFEFRHLEKLETTKFAILDEIREIETDADFPASLSIGLGVNGKSPQQLDDFATAALDLALGRGGDQAVVKRGSNIEYYGGRLQTVEKRNKGKSKIMAHALRQLIDQSTNIIIMGHARPDMDSFGAALGIYRIAKNRSREASIVINEYHESLESIFQRAKDSGNYRFINNEQALEQMNKDTLLIVLDVHKPSMTECPELLTRTERLVVIDHHRKAEEFIENATLTYMESYASSTSELVTEIFQYIGDKKEIDKLEAEALLAGMSVDTKSFSVKTGVRTFEAATWLRRSGADTANVRQLFKVDMEFFRRKSNLIAEAEVTEDGIAYTYTEELYPNIQVLVSQAADDLLNIKGIRASFAMGTMDSGLTLVSGRSLGEFNVQRILEKMGGGGHLTTAGAQVSMSPVDAIIKIKEIMKERES